MSRGVILFLLIVFSSLNSVKAQHPYYYNINDENGLPSNEVYQIIQDGFGYIWIGCDAGLFKYDGFEFKQFKCSNQNGRSISGLELDAKDRIWCRNFNGQIYRVNGDSLKLITDLNQNTANNIFCLDEECNAWIVCQNKLVKFNENGEVITSLLIPNSIGKNSLILDIFFHNKTLYFSQLGKGISIFNTFSKKFKTLLIQSNNKIVTSKSAFFIIKNQIAIISEESHGKEYVISHILNNKIIPFKRLITKEDNKIIYKIRSLSNDDTWVCSSAGTYPFNRLSENLDNIKGFLADKKVSYCIKDREGMYWFSTLNDGIFIIPSLDVLKFDPSNSKLENKNITALGTYNSKTLLIGFSSGSINYLNKNKIDPIEIKSEQKLLTTKRILTYRNVAYVAHGQLTIIDANKKYKALPFYNIRDFIVFKDTLFYVNSDLVLKIGIRDVLRGDQSKLIVLRKSGGRNIALDIKHNRIYFVLNEGVFYYSNGKWTPLIYNGKAIYASSIIYSDQKLWVASISKGLILFKENKFIKSYGLNNGLKESEIKFLNTSNQNIWACGNNFLYRINIKSGRIDSFNKSNGINATEIKTIEIKNRNVYLGTNKGLIVFPENLKSKISIQPKIEILSIIEDKNKVDFRNGIHLNYNHKNVYINLSSTSFKSKSRFHYLYRIKGLSNEWIKIPVQNRRLVLSNLPSGSFNIEIKSINESEIESSLINLPLIVDAPIWKKWWFYLVSSIFFLGTITLIFILRLRFIRKRALLHSKLISSQLTALKAQMNPHFMYNALNSIQDLVLEKDIKNSNLYLSKFSKLMRRILDASGAEKISLQDEIDILSLYLELEKLRFGDDFTFEISWDKSIDTYDVQIPSMIIQPFVENSIKHGLLHKKGMKNLSIAFEISNDIKCSITDNGIGRKHANEIKERRAIKHRSFATNATEKRIELLNEFDQQQYQFEIIDLYENDLSIGTKVVIRMPL